MWIWIVCGLVALVTYFYYTLCTTSGSTYEDNSIDAFIRTGSGGEKTEDQRESKTNRYKKNYSEPGRQILIVYGTEYGFSEEVARFVFDRLINVDHAGNNQRLQPRLVNAKHYHVIDWSMEQVCLVVISTSGDGVPPSDAEEFYTFIMSHSKQFPHLSYSVLALGDSNYPQFCKTGRNLFKRFGELSAKSLVPCHNVDMEDWSVINDWVDQVIDSILHIDLELKQDYLDLSSIDDESGYSRNNPFMAKLKVKRPLTIISEDDDKETIHYEFDISGSDLTWCSGDALGIYPQNNPVMVDKILKCLKYSGDEIVNTPSWSYRPCEGTVSARSVLLKYCDLKHVKPELLQKLTEISQNTPVTEKFRTVLGSGIGRSNANLHDYLSTHELIDVMEEFGPVSIPPDIFISLLKGLQPRYYSISSSPIVDNSRVCVTAAIVRYHLSGSPREGVTTTYLQDRVSVPDQVPVFMSRNPDFRLPGNPEIPVILIGPGTGIAPFRAFIQEREHQGVKNKVYLYFGCRNRDKDFLYREELEQYARDGTIRLSVAFSRDQSYKVYVQDLLQKDSHMIWELLMKDDAHIYVCGDAKQMAHDVHKMLLYIAQIEGKMNEKEAQLYMKNLEENCRYQKDVWIS